MSVQFWILTGAAYIALVFATGYWRYSSPRTGRCSRTRSEPWAPTCGSTFSLRYRRKMQHLLGFMVNPFEAAISRVCTSRQRFHRAEISPYHRINGYHWSRRLRADGRRRLRRLPAADRRIGDTPGIAVAGTVTRVGAANSDRQTQLYPRLERHRGMGRCPDEHDHRSGRPHAGGPARGLLCQGRQGLTEGEGRYGFFYGSIPLYLARKPQTILALEMNGAPLPIEHGVPVRLRIETQLGSKMVKWVTAIEFVADTANIGMGQGGWREDQQYYANAAGI
jgi:hypothetical protein